MPLTLNRAGLADLRRQYSGEEGEVIKHLKLRMPERLRFELAAQAKSNHRSLNSEILVRLIDSLLKERK